MSPTGAPAGSAITRSQIESWDTSRLETAVNRWRTIANESEELFEQQRGNIALPGGTEWEGAAKDAALEQATKNLTIMRSAGQTLRDAADIAANAAIDIRAAKRDAIGAIDEAEADDFKVGEDLRVTDSRRVDVSTMAARRMAANEHAENIRWTAEQLVQADSLVEKRLVSKAAELEDIRFDADDEVSNVVQAVDHKQGPPGLGDLPTTPDGGLFPYPWEPPPPKDSRPGGGRWNIDYDHPYQGDGAPTSPPAVTPWSRDFSSPITGAPSGLADMVSSPPNGWGVQPGFIAQEGYRFRVAGEEYDGSPQHTQWVQRDGNWYPATWVEYKFESEHIIQFTPQNDNAGLTPIRLGMGDWNPTDITAIYQAQADNPGLTLYVPNPFGGTHQLSPSDPSARGI